MDAWPELDRHMHQLADLGRMSALLSWDQQTLMPRRGAEALVGNSNSVVWPVLASTRPMCCWAKSVK